MMKKKILALGSLLSAEMTLLEELFDVIRLWKEDDPETALQHHKNDIVGIVSTHSTAVSRRLIEALPNLEIIAQFAVGTDNIDMDAARARGITVTNTPDILTDDTADIALGSLLSTARRLCEADMYVRLGKWANGPMGLGISLAGKNAGIVGMGRIGQAVAARLEAFNVNVSYYGPREKSAVSYPYYDDLEKLARQSDFLILCCQGGPETENLVDYSIMKALGPHGILINIARGSVIVEDDLLAALSNKALGAAGLDVYWQEPHVPEALFKMDNVVLLPHIGSATIETRSRMGALVIENLRDYFDGADVKTRVI